MSFMWKAKTSLSRSTSASAAPLSSVLGGFSGRQVASIQFNGGCCPGGIKGQRHWRVLLLFVPLVIYSCASHKVNHPLSLTVHAPLSAREKSVAAVFIFNQFLYMKNNRWLLNVLAVDFLIFHHVSPCCTKWTGENGNKSTLILPLHTSPVAAHCYYLQPICLKDSVFFPPSSTINLARHVGTFVTHFFDPTQSDNFL